MQENRIRSRTQLGKTHSYVSLKPRMLTQRSLTPKAVHKLGCNNTDPKFNGSYKKKYLNVYCNKSEQNKREQSHSKRGLTIIETLKKFVDSSAKASTNTVPSRKRGHTEGDQSSGLKEYNDCERDGTKTPINELLELDGLSDHTAAYMSQIQHRLGINTVNKEKKQISNRVFFNQSQRNKIISVCMNGRKQKIQFNL